jgi:hypothetical protein
MDDVKCVEYLIQEQVERLLEGSRPASTIVMAGERVGTPASEGGAENIDTLRETQRLISARVGYEPTCISEDGKTIRWDRHDLTLIQGASLRQTDNRLWLTEHKREAASQRTIDAARRLTDELGGRRFTFLNGTSGVAWGSLDWKTKEQCTIYQMTNRFYLGPDGNLAVAANNNFDLRACLESVVDCKKLRIPFVDLHGSVFKLLSQTFNERDGWSNMLEVEVADPEPYRGEIRRNQSLNSRWTAQTEAAILGVYGNNYLSEHLVPRVRTFLGKRPAVGTKLTREEQDELEDRLPWIHDSLDVRHYARDNVESTKEMRGRAMVDNTLNACNTTLADVIPTLVNGPHPSHHHFLPCHVDYRASSQRNKVPTIRVDFDNPPTFLGIAGDERVFDAVFAKILQSSMQSGTASTGDAPQATSKIVDKSIAQSVGEWMRFLASTASDIDNHLKSIGAKADPEDLKMVQDILSASETGPMIQVARSVLMD